MNNSLQINFSNRPPSALCILIGRWRSCHGDTVATPISAPPFCPITAAALACVSADWLVVRRCCRSGARCKGARLFVIVLTDLV